MVGLSEDLVDSFLEVNLFGFNEVLLNNKFFSVLTKNVESLIQLSFKDPNS